MSQYERIWYHDPKSKKNCTKIFWHCKKCHFPLGTKQNLERHNISGCIFDKEIKQGKKEKIKIRKPNNKKWRKKKR